MFSSMCTIGPALRVMNDFQDSQFGAQLQSTNVLLYEKIHSESLYSIYLWLTKSRPPDSARLITFVLTALNSLTIRSKEPVKFFKA
jgi:hypothetical protein